MLSALVSRVQDFVAAKAQDALLAVLRAGPVPQHVAFVMDGNRRYARRQHKVVWEGHADGFEALRRTLEICMRLGVRCVSVYAFAIENFKRSQDEVDALMSLAEDKLTEMCKHGELLDRHGIRLNVLGRKDLLPPRVQDVVRRAEHMTRHNDRAMLNLCMPFASRDDIATAVAASISDALASDAPHITEAAVAAHIATAAAGSPPVDVLVRTSGVRRLSDFLTWQTCEDAQIQFSPKYWPDFGLWDFVPVLLDYQRKVWAVPVDA